MRSSWLIIALVACGKSKPACRADVDELMVYLRGMNQPFSLVSVDDSVHLVQRSSAAPAKHHGPMIRVEATATRFAGKPGDPDEIATALKAAHRKVADDIAQGNFAKSDPPDPALMYIAADGAATWDRVVVAANAAADAGFTHARFVFARPPVGEPPPRTWVEDKLVGLSGEDGNAATRVAEVASDIIKGCSALQKVYGAVGGEEGGDRASEIVEGTGPALIDCNCHVDMAALRSLMYVALGDPHPTGIVAVELAGSGTPLALPAKTAWTDAAAKVIDGAMVTLVAE